MRKSAEMCRFSQKQQTVYCKTLVNSSIILAAVFPTQIKLRSGSTCLLSSHTRGLSSGFNNRVCHIAPSKPVVWVVYIKLLGIALSRHKIISKFHELNSDIISNEVVLSYLERTFLSESVADNSFPSKIANRCVSTLWWLSFTCLVYSLCLQRNSVRLHH